MPNNLYLASPTPLYYTAQWRLNQPKLINQLVANISPIPARYLWADIGYFFTEIFTNTDTFATV